MINVTKHRTLAPEQAPKDRIKNWNEVSGTFSEKTAVREAMRCVRCRTKPCKNKGCPAKLNIPSFMAKVAIGEYEEAYKIICKGSNLPSTCSRVCSKETQCESSCTCGLEGSSVSIGNIERFVCDWHFAHAEKAAQTKPKKDAPKVCIIGAGPAGLSCAKDLAKKHFDVTVYDKFKAPGGVMAYGIPSFRLEQDIVDREIEDIKALGVKFVCSCEISGKGALQALMEKEGYKAAFVAIGADIPGKMGIPGEELVGVCSSREFLESARLRFGLGENIDKPYFRAKKIVVVGGGNVAMDCARTAKRMGADVTIVYRRTISESPAVVSEIRETEEEGVNFRFLNTPVAIYGDKNGKVKGVECVKIELGEPDESGRRRPEPIEGSEFKIPCDCVVMAIGNAVSKENVSDLGLQTWPNGTIVVKGFEAGEGIFAGGDAVTGPDTVVAAMKAGKDAAEEIIKYLAE